eukprot:gene12348-8476_t
MSRRFSSLTSENKKMKQPKGKKENKKPMSTKLVYDLQKVNRIILKNFNRLFHSKSLTASALTHYLSSFIADRFSIQIPVFLCFLFIIIFFPPDN